VSKFWNIGIGGHFPIEYRLLAKYRSVSSINCTTEFLQSQKQWVWTLWGRGKGGFLWYGRRNSQVLLFLTCSIALCTNCHLVVFQRPIIPEWQTFKEPHELSFTGRRATLKHILLSCFTVL